MTDQSRLTWALVLSVLLHGLLLSLLPVLRRAHLTVPQPPALLDVDVLPMPKPAVVPKPVPPAESAAPAAPAPPPPVLLNRQIVAPPDAGEQKPPEKTRFLSDRDNTVPEEKVRRGEAPGGAEGKQDAVTEQAVPERTERRSASHRAAPAPARDTNTKLAALPKLDQLLPPIGDVAVSSAPLPTPAAARRPTNRNLLVARSSAFSSRPGTNDYLPTVREGDITLLNTKAELFAPFVRRVATRVFQHLEMGLKQAVRGRGVVGGREFAVVEAIMSKQGRLVSARIVERESNSNLSADRQLLDVTKPDIFFDDNPPPGAEASDGNIHFILEVDLTVQAVTDRRTGLPSAGYYGIAGVGLDSEPKRD